MSNGSLDLVAPRNDGELSVADIVAIATKLRGRGPTKEEMAKLLAQRKARGVDDSELHPEPR
jgi:hypothetical protein